MKNKFNDLHNKDSFFIIFPNECNKNNKFEQKIDKKLVIKNKSINKVYKKYNNLLKYILILIFLPLYIFDNNYISSITLTISEDGENKIISDSFEYFPDKIIINNEEVSLSDNSYYFENRNNDITLIWYQEITNCSSMFIRCTYITTIDFSNFDSSKVIDMSYMFYYCISLVEINFNNFITSSVKNMDSMFYYCIEITSLNLINFNTSKVENMKYMFYGCESLSNINLLNFDTSLVTSMNSMFNGCDELTSIDL